MSGEKWWTLPGDVLALLLERAHGGESPDALLLELYANSDTESPSDDPDVAIPLARWDALAEAIDRACDPDQPLIGLAANLEALLCAAADAMPGGES